MNAGRWRVMKMLVLCRQPRRRKDPCKRTYCRRQKIQAGTVFQNSPPRSLLIAYNERCNRAVERSAGPGTPFLFGPSCVLFGQLERKQVSCHPARACLSDWLRGLCWTRAYIRTPNCSVLTSLAAGIRRPCSILRRGCRNAVTRGKRFCFAADPS